MSYAVAFTGHRELKEDFNPDKLREIIEKHLKNGANLFFNGLAWGFDLVALDVLFEFKGRYDFKVIACVPFPGQEDYFDAKWKNFYYQMKAKCDDELMLCDEFTRYAYDKRNKHMVDNSSALIAYLYEPKSGSGSTVRYAKKKGLEIDYVNKQK